MSKKWFKLYTTMLENKTSCKVSPCQTICHVTVLFPGKFFVYKAAVINLTNTINFHTFIYCASIH